MITLSHGGPTAFSAGDFKIAYQFWTSRGFAILDVNYSGSTGFGREYRDRLKGRWGIVDVQDCITGAVAMGAQQLADPARLAIRGGSAGGFTTLAALTSSDVFGAGISQFGIADLEALAKDSHKFEARYMDSLVGPYPEERARYLERSPINHLDRLSAPILLLQGTEDTVVPPLQAEMLADAARRKGLPVALIMFKGEGHGFRRRKHRIDCYTRRSIFSAGSSASNRRITSRRFALTIGALDQAALLPGFVRPPGARQPGGTLDGSATHRRSSSITPVPHTSGRTRP
jgi:dipeptidyl aminopeptidase/acylaminoacyl peptidase